VTGVDISGSGGVSSVGLEVSLLDRVGGRSISSHPGDGSGSLLSSSEGGGLVENEGRSGEGPDGSRSAGSGGDGDGGIESSLSGISLSSSLSSGGGVVSSSSGVECGESGVVGGNSGVVGSGLGDKGAVADISSGGSIPDGSSVSLGHQESGLSNSVGMEVESVSLVSLRNIGGLSIVGSRVHVCLDGEGPRSSGVSKMPRGSVGGGDNVDEGSSLVFQPVEVEFHEVGLLDLE